MNPHLAYLAFWYPPARASGVYRALATTQGFVDAGWAVSVVTADTPFLEDEVGSVDRSLLDLVPPEVDILRVPFTLSLAKTMDIPRLGWLWGNFPTLAAATRRRVMRPGFPDKYRDWIQPVVAAGRELHESQPLTHVLATGNPYSSFEAARLLAESVGARFSVDFRDPWSIDVFTGENAGAAVGKAEARVVSDASLCFHVNDAIATAYRHKYRADSDKHLVVPNGFDAKSIPPPSGPSRGALRFGILGTINERWPLDPIFAAWDRARRDLPRDSELILGGHLGYFGRSSDVVRASFPDASSQFRYVGPVRKQDVASFYRSLDVVVVPAPGGELVTSGKVYEAMALGKPLVCVQADGGGARTLVADHPLSIGAAPTIREIVPAFVEAATAAQSLDLELSTRVQQQTSRFERSRAMTTMVSSVARIQQRAS